jgi:hypothetical protein
MPRIDDTAKQQRLDRIYLLPVRIGVDRVGDGQATF